MPAAVRPCVRCEILKRIGPRNRSGQVQEAIEVQDEVGQPVPTWVTIRGWRFARQDLQGWERVRTDQELGVRVSRFSGSWFAANSKMRILHDDLVWDITGIAELGRRDALELMVQAVRV